MARNRSALALLAATCLALPCHAATQGLALGAMDVQLTGGAPVGGPAADSVAFHAVTRLAALPAATRDGLAEPGMTTRLQGLAINGDFATDLSGWTLSGAGEAAWSTLDVDARPDSGSARLTTRESGPGQRVYPLTLCIDVEQAGRYFVGGSGRLASGQGSGRLVFSYSARASNDCSGGASAVGGRFIGSIDSWGEAAAQLTLHEPPGSIEILLGIEKDDADGELHGNFDDVYVLLDESVFSDGFE